MTITGNSTITVYFFAVFRDQANASQESVPLLSGDTPLSVYERLAKRYGFQLGASDLRMAVNDEFTSSDSSLKPGDQLAFIPPVAGG
jgi:molybdopterin converting factor subunit 1